ncbi:PREDICTED: serum paraoxonase/arylesterase 2-like [Priapulus caudatus]|uniref:Paraoxonase n=1 Tax=Priapulus caudatus TaxID=37621 RepID=A0ABM1EFZ2_PRICU|nr:PREDICTED: serum paraoxonase/arylesterase 2-like [Priapulus caudatus]
MMLKAGFGLILAYLTYRVIRLVYILDLNKETYSHAPGECFHVKGILEYGSEDITLLPSGKALITSGLTYSMASLHEKFSKMQGRIYTFDFDKPRQPVKEVTIKGELDRKKFNPHGISYYIKEGKTTVFVISHTPETVEVFDYKEAENLLVYERTIVDPLLTVGNGLVATSENSFFITKFHHFVNLPWKTFETIGLELNWGAVLHYNEFTKAKVVASDLSMANGITMSPEGKYVYVVCYGYFISYKILKDNYLEEVQRVPLRTAPDNLFVDDASGDVYIGCHPVGYKLLLWDCDPDNHTAPSQVLRLRMKEGKVQSISEVYADDGTNLIGSTVAVYRDNGLLIGTLRDKLMYCNVQYLP